MLTRALIVFLVLLNVSVALWWMLRGEPVVADVEPPAGVAQLQLLDDTETRQPQQGSVAAPPLQDTTVESPSASSPTQTPLPPPATPSAPETPPTVEPASGTLAATPAAAVTPAAASPATPQRCIALGPFSDRAGAQTAQGKTGNALTQARLQEQAVPGSTTRFRVMLPPAASREAAQATVQRIIAAGLSDYYIIAQGPDANAIALGQYRNREGAERRLAAVQAAGFQARLSGGEGSATWWLQGALAEGQTPAGVRQRSGAAQQRSLDCAGLR